MATQRSTHTAGRSMTAGMIGLAVLLAAALIGSLLIALNRSTTIQAPARAVPAAAPAVAAPPAHAGHANRLFADEVAGAGAQYRDAASLTGPLPERLQDLARPAAPLVAKPQMRPGVSSRLFADEIAGASAQYRDAASLTGPLPERLQDLARPTAPAVAAPQMRPGVSSRFFADEIAAGAGVADAMTFEHPGALPKGGPH